MKFNLNATAKAKILCSIKYGDRFNGLIGEVENTSGGGTEFGLRIDGYENTRSSKGLFWFSLNELEFIESEENVMLSPNDNFIVAGVKFLDGNNDKEYYYALFDEYHVGDLVVVQTGHHGLALAEITSTDCDPYSKNKVKCSREIVTRVSMDAFYDRQTKRKACAKLKKEIDKKVKELQETTLYEMLAEKDLTLAAMLAEYKNLKGCT